MKRSPRNRPAPVADAKTSVRTNVARAWHKAVDSMRVTTATAAAKKQEKIAKEPCLELAPPRLPTVPASRRGETIDTPIHWTVDLPGSAPNESGIYRNAASATNARAAIFAPASSVTSTESSTSVPAAPAVPDAASIAQAIEEVTLIVYGWNSVEPGTLAWVFPTARAAVAAVRAMRNAVAWAILSGDHQEAASGPTASFDLAQARADGHVLVEQPI